jgi:hypothetical protein
MTTCWQLTRPKKKNKRDENSRPYFVGSTVSRKKSAQEEEEEEEEIFDFVMASVKLFSVARSAPNVSARVMAANPVVCQKRFKSGGKDRNPVLPGNLPTKNLAALIMTFFFFFSGVLFSQNG